LCIFDKFKYFPQEFISTNKLGSGGEEIKDLDKDNNNTLNIRKIMNHNTRDFNAINEREALFMELYEKIKNFRFFPYKNKELDSNPSQNEIDDRSIDLNNDSLLKKKRENNDFLAFSLQNEHNNSLSLEIEDDIKNNDKIVFTKPFIELGKQDLKSIDFDPFGMDLNSTSGGAKSDENI
jgi:hypothetical protein